MVFSWLVNFLNRGPARVIASDFTFAEADGTLGSLIGGTEWPAAKSDREFAEAVRRSRASVLLADARYQGTEADQANAPGDWTARTMPFRLGSAIDAPGIVLPPFPALLDSATLLGHNFLPLDPDGTARRMLPFIRQGSRFMPSLGIGAALLAGGFRGEEVVLEGSTIRFRDRRMPLVATTLDDGRTQLSTLINYQAPFLVGGRSEEHTSELQSL